MVFFAIATYLRVPPIFTPAYTLEPAFVSHATILVPGIFCAGAYPKMLWVDTGSVTANVIYLSAFWYRPNKDFVRKPMDSYRLLGVGHSDVSVATALIPKPFPAELIREFVYAIQEPHDGWTLFHIAPLGSAYSLVVEPR